MIITIDGPAGSGKSTVAALLAARLGAACLDTGAMYRAVTLAALQSGCNLNDEPALTALAGRCRIDFRNESGVQRVLLDGRDVTAAIRTAEVTAASHKIAGVPAVRAKLVERQQAIGWEYPALVTEGRDQGTVVFPQAPFKFYLDASPECRAQRRWEQMGRPNGSEGLEIILQEQLVRDQRDRGRAVGALKVAEGARRIDTSEMTIEEVVEALAAIIGEVRL